MAEERIPTMPQSDGERIPTMPQGDGERIPTMPQDFIDSINSMPFNKKSNENAGKNSKPTPELMSDVKFISDGNNEYTIKSSELICSDSGESKIYLCYGENDNEKYVAKILTGIYPDSEKEKLLSRKRVIDFLDSQKDNTQSHLLPLADHGTITLSGVKYFVEVYPFCEDGDLEKEKGNIPYKELVDQVIPSVNKALHTMHQAGFVHRDIKPDNLYRYKGRVVIGDFGITCPLDENGIATDNLKTGTLGYYAPELMSKLAEPKSDYYSFGQTLWTLYSGEMMYHNVILLHKNEGIEKQRDSVNIDMVRDKYYGLDEIDKSDSFFEVLILGLLKCSVTDRFGYEQVERWLMGDKSLAKEVKTDINKQYFSEPFVLFGKECWDNMEVCDALCDHWEIAKEMLYEGQIRNFYLSQSYEQGNTIDNIAKEYSSGDEFDSNMGLVKVIMNLSANKMCCWNGKKFRSLSEFADNIEDDDLSLDTDYDIFIGGGTLSNWYSVQENMQDDVLDFIDKIKEMINCSSDMYLKMIALFWFKIKFSTDIVLRNMCDRTDESMLADILLKNPQEFYFNGAGVFFPLNHIYLTILCELGYSDFVRDIVLTKDRPLWIRYDMIFVLLDRIVDDEHKSKVRNFYYRYGPRSYFFWLKDHLDVYEFRGFDCEELKNNIAGVKADDSMSVVEQQNAISTLNEYAVNFRQYDKSDALLLSLGMNLSGDTNCITAKKLSGVWDYEFLGNKAPLGFKYQLGF